MRETRTSPMTSPHLVEKAREFIQRVVALDWSQDGEAEKALATLLQSTWNEGRRATLEEAAQLVEERGKNNRGIVHDIDQKHADALRARSAGTPEGTG